MSLDIILLLINLLIIYTLLTLIHFSYLVSNEMEIDFKNVVFWPLYYYTKLKIYIVDNYLKEFFK